MSSSSCEKDYFTDEHVHGNMRCYNITRPEPDQCKARLYTSDKKRYNQERKRMRICFKCWNKQEKENRVQQEQQAQAQGGELHTRVTLRCVFPRCFSSNVCLCCCDSDNIDRASISATAYSIAVCHSPLSAATMAGSMASEIRLPQQLGLRFLASE